MNDGQQNKHPQEEEIDLLELALKVWAERRWILKCCGYAVIVGQTKNSRLYGKPAGWDFLGKCDAGISGCFVNSYISIIFAIT